MLMRDVMTMNVVTIPSSTSLADARRIMEAHRFRRLPVVDRGVLVGLVTRDALDRAGPSKLTTFSMHEISSLLNKITVKEVMARDPVTVSADATAEEAVALAQEKKIGSLLVVDNGKLVGIATTNDFFYKLLNPLLGIGKPGSRLVVRNCGGGKDIEKVLATVNRLGMELTTMFFNSDPDERSLILHVGSEDPGTLIDELRKLGCSVERRAR